MRLTALKGRHRNERCVLVANGPSLNRMKLDFLRRETVLGVNKIFLGFKKFAFYPRYYVAVNRKVIAQAESQIKALNCVKFIGDAGADGRIDENAMTYLVNTRSPKSRFCKDLATEGMHEGYTVTYAALQVAYFLGFKQVILIGLDHRYEYTGQPNEARRLDGPDPNHFSPDYFGNGQEWDNPDLEHSEDSYRLARRMFEEDGRSIVDATVGGACTVFSKQDYQDIFSSGNSAEAQRKSCT